MKDSTLLMGVGLVFSLAEAALAYRNPQAALIAAGVTYCLLQIPHRMAQYEGDRRLAEGLEAKFQEEGHPHFGKMARSVLFPETVFQAPRRWP